MANQNYECVKAVIESYKTNDAAFARYCFTDEKGKRWVPIIPDVTLTEPVKMEEKVIDENTRRVSCYSPGKLPLYAMNLPKNDFLDKYYDKLKERFRNLLENIYDTNWIGDIITSIAAYKFDDKAADAITKKIKEDLTQRELIS